MSEDFAGHNAHHAKRHSVLSESRRDDLDLRRGLFHRPFLDRVLDRVKKRRAAILNAPSDHHHLGIEKVHDESDLLAEILPGLRLQLPPGMLYNFAGYTHPRFRGSGLQSYRHRSVLDHPRWANASSLLGWVKATNFASRRGQGKSGYRPIGWIWLVGGSRRFAALCSPSLWERGIRRIPVASLPAPDRLPQSPA